MNILVCIKQVPGTSAVEVDPVTGVLKRDGVQAKLNPYDLFALEAALTLAARTDGTVRCLSMGPPQATAALLEAIWMGADEAVLLTDRRFAGSDVAATSYALSLGVRSMGAYDLIVCGKQTTDGDTAQVGPELAERLHIEHATNVCRIGEASDGAITVAMNLDSSLQVQRMQLPCLLSVEKDANTPRLPSYRRKRATSDAQVTVRTLSDLSGADAARCGLDGSPTQVERIFPPEKNVDKHVLQGTSEALADELFKALTQRKFI